MKSTSILLALSASILFITEPSLSQIPPDSSAQGNLAAGPEQPELVAGFGLFAGVSFPAGAFGSTSESQAGAASTGFVGGVEYAIPLGRPLQVLISAFYSYNKMDDSPLQLLRMLDPSVSINVTSWTAVCPMGGIRFVIPMPPGASVFLDGQVGAMFATSPDIKISGSLFSARQSSANAVALALALGGGFSLGVGDLGVRYVYAKPKYHVTATGEGGSKQEGDFEQPTATVQVVATVRF